MIVFYGLDNLLLNQAIDNYLKINYLALGSLKEIDKNAIINYYLESEYFELTIEKILIDASSLDLFNHKKIIIVNDYHLVFNDNFKKFKQFITKIEQFNNNIIIFKILTNKIKFKFSETKVKTIFINSYNKIQLKKWVLTKKIEYDIKFAPEAINNLVSLFPNCLTIIDNELRKMQNLNQVVSTEMISRISSKYFLHNPYKLINFWLNKDYLSFFLHYRSYWEKINYDRINLFLIVLYQLELIRNIKILLAESFSYQAIIEKLNISLLQVKNLACSQLTIQEVNQLMIKAHKLDFQLKSGKIAKNLAIDLFFSNI